MSSTDRALSGSSAFHLAQVNIARLAAPLDSETLRPFVEQLDPVNAAADESEGFIWRLQTDAGDATALRMFDDAELVVNLSVWESLAALRAFAFSAPGHVAVLKQRRSFFVPSEEAHAALWWIPAGSLPTVQEAEGRLRLLRERGPSPEAFTFRNGYPPPGLATLGGDQSDSPGVSA